MLNRKVSPKECALAVSVPLTEAEFEADRRPDSPMKFAKYVRPVKRGERVLTPFERYQSDVLDPLNQVACEVEARGVKVYRGVKLDQINAICLAHPQVTLFAHFEYLLMPPQDIKDVTLFRSWLETALAAERFDPKPQEKSLARRLHNDPAIRAALTKERLSNALSAHLIDGRSYYFPVEDENEKDKPLPPHPPEDATFDRLALEKQFPECFVEARVLELRDGLHTARKFASKVPENYDGLFDLTVCNSILLARVVRDMRQDCNAVCVVWPATFDTRMAIYGQIMEELDYEPRPYEDVSIAVHQAFADEVRRRLAFVDSRTMGDS